MNFFVIVCFLVLALVSAQTPEQIQGIKKIHEKCQSDPATHVDDSVFEKLKNGEKVTDPKWSKHMLCMNVGSGIQNENGDINVDKLRTSLEKAVDNKEKVDEIISKCGTRSSTNAEEAAAALSACLASFRPSHHHH